MPWKLFRSRPRLLLVALEAEGTPAIDLEFWQRALSPSPPDVPPEQRQTVADFWEQCTYGEISPRVGQVTRMQLPVDDPDWTVARTSTDPGQEQVAATRRLMLRALRGGRGFMIAMSGPYLCVLISSLPLARAYAVPGFTRHPWPVAMLSNDSEHATVTHELGHMFGFAHPWGLTGAHPATRDGEYGSPYCVMGMATRQSEVCRSLAVWPGVHGSTPGSSFWLAAGPRLSHAGFLAARQLLRRRPATVVARAPRGNTPLKLTMTDPGGPAQTPRAALVRYPDHDICIEVRRPRPERSDFMDWDARLDLRRTGSTERPSDRDLHDSPGLVVHRIDTGRGRRRTPNNVPRVTYLGSIPLPPSGTRDLHLESGGHLTVLADDGDRVEVALTDGPASPRTEICSLYPADRRDRGAKLPWRVSLHGHVYGGQGNRLTWEIGDLRLTDLKPGDVVRHQVPLPVTDQASGNDSAPGQIEVQVAWDQLTLLIDPCPVGFDLPVRLTTSNGAHAHSEHVVHVPPSRQI